MSALVRQMAVLSVLWALCELLLPNGRQQVMVRAAVSALVLTALLSTAGRLLEGAGLTAVDEAFAQRPQQAAAESYRQTVLRSAANQVAQYCERTAQRAGYQAQAAAYLTQEGGVDHIALRLYGEHSALLDERELVQALAHALGMDAQRIQLSGMGAERE